MIEIRNLSKIYRSSLVLDGMSLNIKKGSVTGIVGPNACGKTTLIKCVLGLVIPTAGEILIDEKKADPLGEFRRKIGYMPQVPAFPGNLCLRELLDMLERLRGQEAPSRQELVTYFGLDQILSQPLEQLSGGTKQKVAAVIAFMFDVPIVILDEPTVGLDPMAAVLFKDLVLKRARQGTTVVLVSHIMTEIETMADEMAFMDDGQVVFAGSVSDLLRQAGVSQLERAVIHLFEIHKEQRR